MFDTIIFFMNDSNSVLVNGVPLSVMNICGRSCVAKMERRCSIVTAEVAAVSVFTTWSRHQ